MYVIILNYKLHFQLIKPIIIELKKPKTHICIVHLELVNGSTYEFGLQNQWVPSRRAQAWVDPEPILDRELGPPKVKLKKKKPSFV